MRLDESRCSSAAGVAWDIFYPGKLSRMPRLPHRQSKVKRQNSPLFRSRSFVLILEKCLEPANDVVLNRRF